MKFCDMKYERPDLDAVKASLADYTDNSYDVLIMNPPFKLFNPIVEKAKRVIITDDM